MCSIFVSVDGRTERVEVCDLVVEIFTILSTAFLLITRFLLLVPYSETDERSSAYLLLLSG